MHARLAQGERRFYLAGMVDDLFLATGQFVYDGDTNEGAEVTNHTKKKHAAGVCLHNSKYIFIRPCMRVRWDGRRRRGCNVTCHVSHGPCNWD